MRTRAKTKQVRETSEVLRNVERVNAGQSFLQIPETYECEVWLESKRAFDSFDPYTAALDEISGNEGYFLQWYNQAFDNAERWRNYLSAVQRVNVSQYDDAEMREIEQKLVRGILLPHPACTIRIEVHWFYMSPKGRNFYQLSTAYAGDSIGHMIEESRRLKVERQTYEYQIKRERALMTESLRYDILKRDGFRCQICGAIQADGVKLHVDHILPVSRGGRTIKSNLRTLCDRCNRGKRDKIEN